MEGRWQDYGVRPANSADFERYVGTIFADRGYDVLLPPSPGDFGADLLLVKVRTEEQSIVVIRFLDEGLVGSDAVQQAASAMLAWGVEAGWVVTNASGFTANAKELAASDNIYLVDGEGLRDMVMQITGRRLQGPVAGSDAVRAATSIPLGTSGTAAAAEAAPAASTPRDASPAPAANVPGQPPVASDPFAPASSAPVAGMPPMDYAAFSAGYPASPAPGYPGMPPSGYPDPMAAGQAPYMSPYPQYPALPKERHLGWLISILATIAIILVILALYIFIAPSIFDAIEADNPGLHIVRWEEVIDAITSS